MFVTYTSQTNGVPQESKLATYMVIVVNEIGFVCLLITDSLYFQNRQSPGAPLTTAGVTKHLSGLSLDGQKKTTASPEFVPGRGLAGSNSSSPNLFNNSYHSQENVGGTTYFYLGTSATENVAGEEGAEAVSSGCPIASSNSNYIDKIVYVSRQETQALAKSVTSIQARRLTCRV